jgi:hypothetical protein
LQVDVGWIVSSAKKSLSRFGDLVPLFSKNLNSVWINENWSAEFFIGLLSMTDAIGLCSSVAKSTFSVDVELDSLVVFLTVAVTDTVSVDWVDVLDGANLMKNFFVKFSWQWLWLQFLMSNLFPHFFPHEEVWDFEDISLKTPSLCCVFQQMFS